MTKMVCVFPDTNNIGDYIQTLPIYEICNGCDFVDREKLSSIEGQNRRLILNGWYCHEPRKVFPIHPDFDTHVLGFHLASSAHSVFTEKQLPNWREQDKQIGCRDNSTYKFMQDNGIQNTYVSYCPSILNVGTGARNPDRKVAVDFPVYLLPNGHEYHIESSIIPNYMTVKQKISLARDFLNFLYQKAELVVTSRIHVALPCVAMGVPVIFYGDKKNERLSLLKDLGIIINDFPTFFPLSKNHRTASQMVKYFLNRNNPKVTIRSKTFDDNAELLKLRITQICECA